MANQTCGKNHTCEAGRFSNWNSAVSDRKCNCVLTKGHSGPHKCSHV